MELLNILILVIHVLGAAIVIGSIFVSVLILFMEPIPRPNLELIARMWTIVSKVIGIQILTGIYLAGIEWDSFRHNPFLWIKLVLLTIDGVVGGRAVGPLVKQALATDKPLVSLPGARPRAVIALLIFLLMATLGVLMVEGQA